MPCSLSALLITKVMQSLSILRSSSGSSTNSSSSCQSLIFGLLEHQLVALFIQHRIGEWLAVLDHCVRWKIHYYPGRHDGTDGAIEFSYWKGGFMAGLPKYQSGVFLGMVGSDVVTDSFTADDIAWCLPVKRLVYVVGDDAVAIDAAILLGCY